MAFDIRRETDMFLPSAERQEDGTIRLGYNDPSLNGISVRVATPEALEHLLQLTLGEEPVSPIEDVYKMSTDPREDYEF